MAFLPCCEFCETIVEEDVEKGEKLVFFQGNNRVQFQERVKIEDGGKAEGSCHDLDGSNLC